MGERTKGRGGRSTQRWIRAAIIAVGVITIVAYAVLSPILRGYAKRDRASSTPRVGVGTVEQLVPPRLEENLKPTPAQAWVRIDGQLVAAESVFGSAQLKVGAPARVTYRVGRSGRVYVDRVEPVPESRPADERRSR